MVFQRKETPPPDLSAGRDVRNAGVWHSFCLSKWGSGSRIFRWHASTHLALSSGPERKLGTFWGLDFVPPAPAPFIVAGHTWHLSWFFSRRSLWKARSCPVFGVRPLTVKDILSPWFFLEKLRSCLTLLLTLTLLWVRHTSEYNLLATK